ncbi:MAG: N-acetylmuramoyl-L-alanine amidase [Pseudomonadota bacterium]
MTFGWTTQAQRRQYRAMAVSTFLMAMIAPLSPADANAVSAVEMGDREITIRFDDVVEKASSFVLAGPDRIAIDVTGAEPGAPVSPIGVIRSVRQGRPDANTARIVFDLAEPAVISGGQFAADGRSLTLSVDPAADDDFSAAAKAARKLYLPPIAYRAKPPHSRYNITIPLDAPKSGLPRPKIYGPAGRPLVVIDAGHGGHDPGAISPSSGKREKDITLATAKAIRDELLASGRVRVALTREDDTFIILENRSVIARNIKADLFISIHADSASAETASGATIYTLSEVASDREAQILAARENRANVINGVNLGGENREIASILVDLAQRESMNASADFANLLKREAGSFVPFRSDYHRMAGFVVLKAPDIPSVLLEIGYLTNSTDVSRLASTAGQKRIASGIRKAVEVHFAKRLASR